MPGSIRSVPWTTIRRTTPDWRAEDETPDDGGEAPTCAIALAGTQPPAITLAPSNIVMPDTKAARRAGGLYIRGTVKRAVRRKARR